QADRFEGIERFEMSEGLSAWQKDVRDGHATLAAWSRALKKWSRYQVDVDKGQNDWNAGLDERERFLNRREDELRKGAEALSKRASELQSAGIKLDEATLDSIGERAPRQQKVEEGEGGQGESGGALGRQAASLDDWSFRLDKCADAILLASDRRPGEDD